MRSFLKITVTVIIMINQVLAQWSSDPLVNSAISLAPGEQAIPKVVTTIYGFTYVAWFSNESGNYDVILQVLDIYGNKLWAEEGLLISDHPAMTWLTDWDITADEEGCAILTFQDIRNGSNDVFAYRISFDGDFLWGEDGIEMSTGSAMDVSPKVTVTSAGNAVFAWQADDVVILQKISPEGEKLWGEWGITLSGTNTFSWPQLIPVGADEVILKYFEDSGPVWAPTRHVYAQRYDPDGNPVWDSPAVISNAGGISAWTQIFPFINDGSDGFFIAWHDDRDNNMLANMWVQHIGSNGNVLLADDGAEVTTMSERNHFYANLALPPGSGNIFVFWNEMDADQNNRGIYGQKISPSGERLWTDNGKPFIELSMQDVYPYAARNTNEDMIVFYEEDPTFPTAKIKAMRIDTEGNFVWPGDMVYICSLPSEKIHAETGNFYGQWITVWEDKRNGVTDIYGQNIKPDGTLGPIYIPTQLDVYPDSLFFDDYQSTTDGLYFTIKNNTNWPWEIINFPLENYLPGWMWSISNFTGSFPLVLVPEDSLNLLVNIYFPTGSTDWFEYVYDSIPIETDIESYSVTICLNSDLITGNDDLIMTNKINCYPNPSSNDFTFEFYSAGDGVAELIISDAKGIIIKSTGSYVCNIGMNSIYWDGKSDAGSVVPAGVYYYRLKLNDSIKTGRFIKNQKSF
jgi:hypothetical protein